jgi:hypothetical protein
MNWKSTVEPIDAPPFISSQNVSSSVPVMPQSYRGRRLCNELCGSQSKSPAGSAARASLSLSVSEQRE